MRQVMAFVLVLLMSIPVCVTATGSLTVGVRYDVGTREVTISGTASPDSVISMMVITDEAGDAVVTPENVQDIVFAAFQVKADARGNYTKTFTFDTKPNEDWYTVTVYSKKDSDSETTRFYMPASSEEMLSEFDEAGVDGMYAVVEKYAVTYPILVVEMDDYKEEYRTEISAAIVEQKPFASNNEIEDAIKYALGTVNLKHCDAEEMDGFLSRYSGILEIELDEDYDDIKDEMSELFTDLRRQYPTKDIDDLVNEAMAVAAVNNADRSDIEDVLRRYDHVFDVDLDAFDKYESLDIAKALYDKGYTKAADVEEDFDERVKALKKANSSSDKNSGGNWKGNAGGGYSTDDKIRVDSDLYTDSVEVYQLPFTDLDNVEWAKEYIKKLYARGIVTGISENLYDPEAPVKRSEISKMIVKVLETEIVIGENPFADVPEDAWYTEFVINAYENGLITGYDGKFNPENNILRRDLALIVSRALEANGYSIMAGASFNDITADDEYAKAAIESLAAYGVIDGKGNGNFAPSDYVTRAEAAKIISNMVEVLAGE